MWRLMHDPKSFTRRGVFMIFFNEAFSKTKVSLNVMDAWHSELPGDPQTYPSDAVFRRRKYSDGNA